MPDITTDLVKADPFFIQFGDTYLHGDLLLTANASAPTVLFLHGDDTEDNRQDFFMLRQVLLRQYGISSCAFDFVGHGNTSGRRSVDISYRSQQVREIIDACFDCGSVSIVAAGSGVQVAGKLIYFSPDVRRLVFFSSKMMDMPEGIVMNSNVLYLPEHLPDKGSTREVDSVLAISKVLNDSTKLVYFSKKIADFLTQPGKSEECKEM